MVCLGCTVSRYMPDVSHLTLACQGERSEGRRLGAQGRERVAGAMPCRVEPSIPRRCWLCGRDDPEAPPPQNLNGRLLRTAVHAIGRARAARTRAGQRHTTLSNFAANPHARPLHAMLASLLRLQELHCRPRTGGEGIPRITASCLVSLSGFNHGPWSWAALRPAREASCPPAHMDQSAFGRSSLAPLCLT